MSIQPVWRVKLGTSDRPAFRMRWLWHVPRYQLSLLLYGVRELVKDSDTRHLLGWDHKRAR